MPDDTSNESSNITKSDVDEAVKLINAGLEASVKTVTEGAIKLNEVSERFAEKAPGQRASWLGFLLIVSAVALEIFSGNNTLEFSEITSMGMLLVGGILVVAGGAFDTYFTIKTAQAYEARATALERAAEEIVAEANKNRSDAIGMLKRLVGADR